MATRLEALVLDKTVQQIVGVLEEIRDKETSSGGGGSNYVLPVASSSTLGGIKADSKQNDDTLPVRVDANGKLWASEQFPGVKIVNGEICMLYD